MTLYAKWTLLDLPGTLTITSDNNGLHAAYSGEEADYLTYQWNMDDTPILNANSTTHLPAKFGVYTVTVTSTRGYNPKTSDPVSPSALIFTDIAAMTAALSEASNNTAATAYNVKLNVSSLPWNWEPEGVAQAAFANKYVNLDLSGSTFTTIIRGAFKNCIGLTSIVIPASVTTIDSNRMGYSPFESCTNLTSVTFAAGSQLTSIAQATFRYCSSLPSVDLPATVTSIESYVFEGCTGLISITIPSGVISIADYVFTDCSSLSSVTFEGTIGSSSFGMGTFLGDLRDKYFDSDNGGPGTYTTSNPGNYSAIWTKVN